MTHPVDRAAYLGVDAGNSKTVAVLADAQGRVLGLARGGRGDIYAGEDVAVETVAGLVEAALASLGDAILAATSLCLAGVDWADDSEVWHARLAERLPRLGRYVLRNDGFATLRAARLDGCGVAVTAGTGAAVVSRGPSGEEWTASFWILPPLGGGALGRAALEAVVRADLGLDPPTAMSDAMLERFGCPDVATLLEESTRRGSTLRTAGAARLVLAAADGGDPVAAAIVDRQAVAFVDHARVAAAKGGFAPEDPVPVVLGGSVLTGTSPALRDRIVAESARTWPTARVTPSPRSPVVGAVLDAMAEGGVPVTDEIADRLAAHEFPADFLLT